MKKIKETELLSLNINKAKKNLKWKTKLSLNQTLSFIAEWYLCYINDKKNIEKLSRETSKEIFMIEGVKIIPKQQIIDERGKIMHMMRNDDENFTQFGEIYFSYSHPNTVKAWHLHKKMTVNYVCVVGKIKLVLFDDRSNSITKNVLQEIFLTGELYTLVYVCPPEYGMGLNL